MKSREAGGVAWSEKEDQRIRVWDMNFNACGPSHPPPQSFFRLGGFLLSYYAKLHFSVRLISMWEWVQAVNVWRGSSDAASSENSHLWKTAGAFIVLFVLNKKTRKYPSCRTGMVSLNSQAVAVVTCFHCSKEKHRIANRFVQNNQFLCCVSVYKPPLKATGFNGGVLRWCLVLSCSADWQNWRCTDCKQKGLDVMLKKKKNIIFHHVGLMEELCEIVVQFAFYL